MAEVNRILDTMEIERETRFRETETIFNMVTDFKSQFHDYVEEYIDNLY